MEHFSLIALSHKQVRIDQIGQFHLDDARFEQVLKNVKSTFQLEELLFLSTCNRVELLTYRTQELSIEEIEQIFLMLLPNPDAEKARWAAQHCSIHSGSAAIRHLMNVSASLDSLVVGEREIITQVRTAYDKCKGLAIAGDRIRIAVQSSIVTAKEVYTNTKISSRPVSVVSLAYRQLNAHKIPDNARFLIIGAGQTNSLMAQFLKKHAYSDFRIFNRSLDAAQTLAQQLQGKAFPLSALAKEGKGFDVLITCTAAAENIITKEIYSELVDGDGSTKLIIDLSVPHDVAPAIPQEFPVHFIDVNCLQEMANVNLRERELELEACRIIIDKKMEEFMQTFRMREIELAMKDVPVKIKEIKQTALHNVFAAEVAGMDPQNREILEKVMDYMEKKFISVPMKMAKEIIVNA
jgi:glutamyl-tRNA reductase